MIKNLIKEILTEEITGKAQPIKTKATIDSAFIGQIVMVRTYSAGVHFGTLEAKEGQTAILKDARRVYSWVKAATLSQLAIEGSKDIDSCKIAMTTHSIQLDRVIEVIPMTDKAINNLCGATEWKC